MFKMHMPIDLCFYFLLIFLCIILSLLCYTQLYNIYMCVFHRDSTSELFQWLPRKHITLERSLKLFAEEFYN